MSKSFRSANPARRFTSPVAARALVAGLVLAGVAVAPPVLARSAEKAETAMASDEMTSAVRYAEKAVAEAPRDGASRALLGQAYLRAGRLASARAALREATMLGEASPRVALMLALAEIGSGDARTGVMILAQQADAIPAADRGLAFALAGETARGVEIISADIRAGNDNPKNRQNLAYAFALDGRWREARMMAAQDVPADVLDQRMTEWAMHARPDQAAQRVAALVGAQLREDRGMPTALALANYPAPASAAPAPVMAAAEPAAPIAAELPAVETQFAEAAPVTAPAAPLASAVAVADVPASNVTRVAVVQPTPAAPATKLVAKAAPVKVAAPRQALVKPAAAKLAAAPAKAKAALPVPQAGGSHVAQLGSYGSMADARAGWKTLQARYANLRGSQPVITQAKVDGKDYWRVAAGGFDAKGAGAMCTAVKAGGNGCLAIARPTAVAAKADSKVRMARAD